MNSFNEFIKSRNEICENEILPYLCEQNDSKLNEQIDKNNSIGIGGVIGIELGESLRNANYISLKHLEAYHKWLFDNFVILPKK